jgi:hypothetical protein
MTGMDVFVSPPAGADLGGGSGTLVDPLHSIAEGIKRAAGGGTVHLRAGTYVESVVVENLAGTARNKIVVRPFEDEQATIDSLLREFLEPTAEAHWEPVAGQVDEYVWTRPFPMTGQPPANSVTRGAFLDREPHTRLITYHQLDDLRAEGQLFPKDVNSGNRVWRRKKIDNVTTYEITDEHRPSVYMGPGIWFDSGQSDSVVPLPPLQDATRLLHIRLSPTTHQLDGVEDYTGETDPRLLRLALSLHEEHVLKLVGCQHLRFENLTLRFGDEDTVRLRNCCDIVFDHVRIRAASRAVRLEGEADERNVAIRFRHCELDGGLPPWLFRSDRKDNYLFGPDDKDAPDEQIRENNLGSGTTGALISSGAPATRVTVHHCELRNSHDVFVFGDQMRFHHNWLNNINDDALAFAGEHGFVRDAWVYRNVLTRCLTALSFGIDRPVGDVKIFRNLIDLREPTLGVRPAFAGENRSLRQGHFWKGDRKEGPFDLWHNTCIVLDPGGRGSGTDLSDVIAAGFQHYGSLGEGQRRRAFNNIFVAVFTRAEPARAIAFLPPSSFAGPTDANTYHQVGPGADVVHGRFLVPVLPDEQDNTSFTDLATYSAANAPYEEHGLRADPRFQSFDAVTGRPASGDDLRLMPDSPSATTAVPLPADLQLIDGPPSAARGCYRTPDDRLNVGVDGRRQFPPP